MAEEVLSEIGIAELELIQSVQTAIKAFEARNPGKVVNALTFKYASGASIKYEADIKTLGSTAIPSS